MKSTGLLIVIQGAICILFTVPTLYALFFGNLSMHMNAAYFYLVGIPAIFGIGLINILAGMHRRYWTLVVYSLPAS